MNILQKIIQEPFPEFQYYKEEHEKKQIVLHHTASGPKADGDIAWWKNTPERVATCIIIPRDGIPRQLFSSKFWAHHLGIKQKFIEQKGTNKSNTYLNQHSIGIEIDSWGQLTKTSSGEYKSYTGAIVKAEDVVEYKDFFRGFQYYERYTEAQIESVKELLLYWGERYKIPLTYNEDIFTVSKRALNGEPGVWSHVSFRSDKYDLHPQKEIVEMLKSL